MKAKVTIPTELKDIKLSQFQKYLKVTEGSEDVNFINRTAVGIFCNLSDEQVNAIKAKDFDFIVNTINETLNKQSELVPRFTLDGIEYGFIPDIENITLGEKIDIDNNINDWQKMDKMMGVCYRPINYKHKNTYLIDEYTGEEKALDVTLDVAIGCMVFFYDLMKDLVNFIPNFIEAHLEDNPKALQILEKNGGNIKTFTQSLEVIFSDLMTLQNLNYIKH